MPNEPLLQRMKRLGYVWTESVEQKFQSFAEEAKECLRKEAERCDCIKLLDDDAMYEQFKQNIDLEEEYANVILSKILKLKLEMKVIYWALGKYLFTDAERTMVEYFCNVKSGKVLTRKAFRPEFTFGEIAEKNEMLSKNKHSYFTVSTVRTWTSCDVKIVDCDESMFLYEVLRLHSELHWIFLGCSERIVKFFNCEPFYDYYKNVISEKEYNKRLVKEKRKIEEFAASLANAGNNIEEFKQKYIYSRVGLRHESI